MQRLFSALRYFPKLVAFFSVEKVTAKSLKQAQENTKFVINGSALLCETLSTLLVQTLPQQTQRFLCFTLRYFGV
jgi:hypothetical protein